jgi:hypothetical protein
MAAVTPHLLAAPYGAAPRLARLIPADEYADYPDPEYLIDQMIPSGSFGMLYGPSGVGKSFLALDLAAHVCVGGRWMNREIRQGPIVYIAAEGQVGIRKRIGAWKRHRDIGRLHGFYIWNEPVQLDDDRSVSLFLGELGRDLQRPSLIVVDTFAQCYSGDENNHEVQAALDGIQRIIGATGATVLLVHHSVKADAGIERGSTRLRAAADWMMKLLPGGNGVCFLESSKMKDAEPFARMAFQIRKVSFQRLGVPAESAVLVPADPTLARFTASSRSDRVDTALLEALVAAGKPLSTGAWQLRVADPKTGAAVSRQVFQKARNRLCERGEVVQLRKGFYSPVQKNGPAGA